MPDSTPNPHTNSSAESEMQFLPITVEFSGGLELLFSNQRVHHLTIPSSLPSSSSSSESPLVSINQHSAPDPTPQTVGTEPPNHPIESPEARRTEKAGTRTNLDQLITYLATNLLRNPRRELFVMEGSVRPGILVLINETDWSLEGEGEYEIQAGDQILFISTLHGG